MSENSYSDDISCYCAACSDICNLNCKCECHEDIEAENTPLKLHENIFSFEESSNIEEVQNNNEE